MPVTHIRAGAQSCRHERTRMHAQITRSVIAVCNTDIMSLSQARTVRLDNAATKRHGELVKSGVQTPQSFVAETVPD